MRDRLIKLTRQAQSEWLEKTYDHETKQKIEEYVADYLIANGVVVIDTDVVSVKNRPLIAQCFGRPLDEVIEIITANKANDDTCSVCGVGKPKGEISSIPSFEDKFGYKEVYRLVCDHL